MLNNFFTGTKQKLTGFTTRLNQQQLIDFTQYAITRFPEHFSNQPQEKLIPQIKKICKQAHCYGINNNSDLASVIDLTVLFGENFYDEVWAKDVVSVPHLSGTEKMKILRERMSTNLADF